MAPLRLFLLGGFRARLGETDLQFPTKKSEGLLAYLAMPVGQMHAREKLAALLWGDSAEEQARQSLRQTLFTLRKLVNAGGEVLIADGDRVGLDAANVDLDVTTFLDHLASKDSHRMAEAVELYRGEFLEGLSIDEEEFESWIAIERDRLRESALAAYGALLERQTAAGELDAAVQTALRLLAIDPLQDSTHRLLMRLYLQQGRREAALKQYQTCREALQRQLGVEPETETRKLYEEIVAASAAQTRPRAADERTRILLVEDNNLNRQLVLSMLDEKKFDVAIAEDGAQALLQLGNRSFDLVLLDIKLPNIDGLTLLKVIRENGYQVPTILMTAMPGPEAEITGLKLGAADFVRKPLQKNVLLARIEKVLRGGR